MDTYHMVQVGPFKLDRSTPMVHIIWSMHIMWWYSINILLHTYILHKVLYKNLILYTCTVNEFLSRFLTSRHFKISSWNVWRINFLWSKWKISYGRIHVWSTFGDTFPRKYIYIAKCTWYKFLISRIDIKVLKMYA